ncbi:M23 family metallopeptidase [Sinimarinibacterium flocculans]|uniref:M23 family metallopeptidase n=1 Tax=Sinimarinibacterium flocculans TaxID=985250 RepID=UPI0035157FC5
MMRHVLCALLLAGVSASGLAAAPDLHGRWMQGGLIRGQTEPGAQVWFNGKPLRVSPAGDFAFGLAYEEGPAAELRVRRPDGSEQRHEYAVERREYDEQRISGLPQKMVTPPEAALKQIALDNQRVAAARARDSAHADFAGGFDWPLSATVSGVFGSRRILNGEPRQPHFGIDLAAPKGTAIKAPAGGVVSLARDDLYYTGGTIILDHGQGVSTTYLHLSRLNVKPGQRVERGQTIGLVGATGRATGPHLCWRANWFDTRLDPSLIVDGKPVSKGERRP